MAFQGVPSYLVNEGEHRRQIAACVNKQNNGKFNCTLAVTLTASAASTTVTDSRIGTGSLMVFMPQTAHAAAEMASGNLYIPASTVVPALGSVPGKAVIQHTNNSQTDRTFIMGIFG
jgi:hypothetical protein